jgi:Tol biopolymer transport system component
MICPEWSPTGQHVAFRVEAELWIADAASGATRVVPIVSVIGREENELEWSRDGSMIAIGEPGQIRVVHLDGGAPTLIRVEGATPRSLGWDVRDERIVYVSVVPVDENGSGTHVVGVDGTNDTRLTPVATTPGLSYSFDEAAVSPDGTRVAYRQGSRQCDGGSCGPGPELKPIGIADLDGSNAVEVSGPADFAAGLRWSPDGKRLLLSSIEGVVSVGLEPGSPATVYASGKLNEGLNLEWSWSEVTWQPVLP